MRLIPFSETVGCEIDSLQRDDGFVRLIPFSETVGL